MRGKALIEIKSASFYEYVFAVTDGMVLPSRLLLLISVYRGFLHPEDLSLFRISCMMVRSDTESFIPRRLLWG